VAGGRIQDIAGPALYQSIQQALQNKRERAEVPVVFGMEQGSPQRFAGDELVKTAGMNGQFGAKTEDPSSRPYFKKFVSRYVAGEGLLNGGGAA
jgi:hypothetical protein